VLSVPAFFPPKGLGTETLNIRRELASVVSQCWERVGTWSAPAPPVRPMMVEGAGSRASHAGFELTDVHPHLIRARQSNRPFDGGDVLLDQGGRWVAIVCDDAKTCGLSHVRRFG
jgi:hypothetical protein